MKGTLLSAGEDTQINLFQLLVYPEKEDNCNTEETVILLYERYEYECAEEGKPNSIIHLFTHSTNIY